MATRAKFSCDESKIIYRLHSGDQMTQEEFHRYYCAMPDGYRAELIGGIVFEPSPLGMDHSDGHTHLSAPFLCYAGRTPGLQVGDSATVILGDEDEVQPDLFLRIRPKYRGQSRDTLETWESEEKPKARYVEGAPELVAEVAHSSKAIDLHRKKKRYKIAGVMEYLVVCLYPTRIYWFDLRSGKEFSAGADGIFRSVIFPGLWIDSKALFEGNYDKLMGTIAAGMSTAKYRSFRTKLAQRLKK